MATESDFEMIFNDIDKQKKGYVLLENVLEKLELYGYKCPQGTKSCFNNQEVPANTKMNLKKFIEFMKNGPPILHKMAMLRRVFNKLDVDNDGRITKKELTGALSIVGNRLTKAEADKMMLNMDQDGSNTIEVEEFISSFFGNQLN